MLEAIVNRSERTRGRDHRTGALTEAAATSALLQAFELEATMLLGEGPVARPALADAIAEHLGPNWGLAPGPAAVAADEAIRFWDETGVFTASGATETVTPRLALFSEIGGARQAARGDATQIRAWVAEAAERDVYECIALAAGLNTDVAATMVEVAAVDGDDVPSMSSAGTPWWAAAVRSTPRTRRSRSSGAARRRSCHWRVAASA